MNTAPCGFVAFADDGTIVAVNRTLCEFLGYQGDDLVGRHIDSILPPGGRIFYHTYLFPLLKVEGQVEEIYAALRTRAGEDVPILLNGIRRERGGAFVSDCVVVRMVQRNAYEDQLLQARRLAEESNAAKAKFLSMMSHDLRTPLTAIEGNAQLLESGMLGPLEAEQIESVRAIREAARMQMTLVSDILEFARLESGRVQLQSRPVAVAQAVARAEALVRVQASEAGLRFSVARACHGDAAVLADPDRLQQILLNLVTNALKFTPPGGEVTVICESDGERVLIRVRDSGVGIPSAHLQRIFSPFVQLDSPGTPVGSASSRGVGLGLAISRDLARAMRGDVTVESTPGAGSTFTIELPAALRDNREASVA